MVLCWVSIPSINASFGAGFGYSRVSGIVFTARLIPPGILADYVTERCETDTNFFLCEFKNTIPDYTRYDYFLWNNNSFLYQQDCDDTKGFAECWLKRDSIFGLLVDDILSTQKYRLWFLGDVIKEFGNQLTTFHLSADPPFGKNSHINYPINRFFKKDYDQYLQARQQNHVILYHTRNLFQQILIITSLVVILLFLSLRRLRKFLTTDFLTLLLSFVILILVNASLMATVSIVIGRYEGRFIWFIPVLAFILLARYALDKNEILADK